MSERTAKCGEVVLLTYGDPMVIGGNTMEFPLMVVQADGDVVYGQAFPHPGFGFQTPQGVVQPPLIPVFECRYSAVPKPMTWRFREDVADRKPTLVGL